MISEATTVYTPSSVGINENQHLPIKFDVMPNPTQDYLFIYMGVDSKNNVKGSLIDAKGKVVQKIDYLQPSIAYTIDMTSLSNGIYFLILESENQKTTHKIVKSN